MFDALSEIELSGVLTSKSTALVTKTSIVHPNEKIPISPPKSSNNPYFENPSENSPIQDLNTI